MGRTWRKEAKKLRRKRIRQLIAKNEAVILEQAELQKESMEEYKLWTAEQEKMETFKKLEEERINEEENEKWLRTELIAQVQWRELQEKISKARFERAQQDLRIKKEWEEQQKKIQEAEENRKKLEEDQLKSHREFMKRLEEFSTGQGELPSELLTGRETNPDKEMCPFFSKTGACRFGDSCSRNHRKPGVSKTLLAMNFYSHFCMDHSTPNEYDNDILLEYEDNDTYRHFLEFFDDVLPEFQTLGRVVQFKVCCNYERHLRGNTYIEYASLPEALNAYRLFHGRWYGGKQVSLQFCDIPSWKRAICGLFAGKRCPKGRACNFLHVFRNPNNMFGYYENRSIAPSDSHRSRRGSFSRSRSKENHWRWSESPPSTGNEQTLTKSDYKHRRSRRESSDRREPNRERSRTRRLLSSTRSTERTISRRHQRDHKSERDYKSERDHKSERDQLPERDRQSERYFQSDRDHKSERVLTSEREHKSERDHLSKRDRQSGRDIQSDREHKSERVLTSERECKSERDHLSERDRQSGRDIQSERDHKSERNHKRHKSKSENGSADS